MSSPSKLFSCVDANTILKSPVNNSTAKNHWSFSKDSRFKIPKYYCDSFYNIPHTKSARKTNFGVGKKTDLDIGKHRHNIIPASTTYDIKSFIDINKTHNKGFTPRYSRQEIQPMSYIDVEAKKVPGPGTYEKVTKRDTPKWSMRRRVNSQLFEKTTQRIVPGPGSHENKQCIDPVGKYYLSKNVCSKAKVFNPKHSERFSRSMSDFPGAGNYNPKTDHMPKDGNYINSRNKSIRNRGFLWGRRDAFVQQMPKRVQTPGPGTYRIPSQFGQYDQIQLKRASTAKQK